ncbi:MAG TPA: HAD-IA family hydrolase [Candidatus Saccharimonadales bacterium]|nr:HAD-IA family hydrolase [Candidatus Saccharimonadales bacterium]
MDEVGLGRSLQRARQAAGLTQQELCQRAGLSYSTLAKIERGAIKAPSIFTIQKIAGVLGVDLSELIGKVEQNSNQAPLEQVKKRSKTGIRFVYFDVNGCLVRFYYKAFNKIAAETGVGAEVIETAFWHYNDAICRGEITMDEFNRKLAEKIGIPKIDWQPYYLDAVEPVPEMQELLVWASDIYEVGLLSNIMPGLIDALIAHKQIPDIKYSSIIDSSQIGAVKPEAKIYEIAQAKSGVQPQEILLIDDSRANLMAGEHFGWHVLWFDAYEPRESVPRIKASLEPEN